MLSALFAPFVDPASRTHVLPLATALLVGAAVLLARKGPSGVAELFRPFVSRSGMLDVQLLLARQLLRFLGWIPGLAGSWALAVAVVGGLDRVARPDLSGMPGVAVLYTVVLFVAWDASRFGVHWLLHRVPTLWAFHRVHHSAETLSPLTFHRVHPVESALYQLRGLVVTGLLAGVFFWLFRTDAEILTVAGVHAIGWGFNMVSGNLRHSPVWLGFGALERWLISPAQHQLHHGAGHDDVNLGTWLAIWDRLAGTHAYATEPPERFGLVGPAPAHDLLSAWGEPFVEVYRLWAGADEEAPRTP